jgi:hypothetical protein
METPAAVVNQEMLDHQSNSPAEGLVANQTNSDMNEKD